MKENKGRTIEAVAVGKNSLRDEVMLNSKEIKLLAFE